MPRAKSTFAVVIPAETEIKPLRRLTFVLAGFCCDPSREVDLRSYDNCNRLPAPEESKR